MPRPVIIDCDPGQDDAVMLLLACASPELDVLGVTTVAGNVPLDLTQRNARLMLELAGRSDVPVYAGCDRPLKRAPITAEAVHGMTGIDGYPIHEPALPLAEGHAVDFIIETCRDAADGAITLVPTGPLTNIATALTQEPAIASKIEQIVLMGGAFGRGGNVSPVAEFNILADPEAAKIVFGCGRPTVAFGLDVTQQVLTTPARLERIRAISTPVAEAVAGMLTYYDNSNIERYGGPGRPLHDPCPIAWLIQPDLFTGRQVNVDVETGSELTDGMTVVDLWGVTDRPKHTLWMREADADGLYALLTERLAML
ncbi:MAG: nucleoside hydrolase [Alphaproteobacteria bacterium]|nr:nucleoside hydrolase [Alphaproteobacteria bacterium]